jgi:hypothetical protein
MNRWVWFIACVILGLLMVACGLLIPAHLRAVDAAVLQKAGRKTPDFVEVGLNLVQEKKPGPAQLMLKAAQQERVLGRERLADAVDELGKHSPDFQVLGSKEPRLEILFGGQSALAALTPSPFTDFAVRQESRERILGLMRISSQPLSQELLRCRELTNTVLFSPSHSASGQALDTAIGIAGLLSEEKHLSAGLSNAFFIAAAQANHGGTSERVEGMLMDVMSLGQRFDWGQLAEFVAPIEDSETLRLLTNFARKDAPQLPVIFSAVELSRNPVGVAKYLMAFSQSGMADLGAGLRYGAGGLNELLRRGQRMSNSALSPKIGLESCLRTPWFALSVKWLSFLAGGFLLAAGMHFARPSVSPLERPLQVGGFHVAREFLFALGFLLVVLLLSEPFLAQESQRVEMPFRLRLPMVGAAAPAQRINVNVNSTIMNQLSLLTLLLFFVLQALIYTACIVKLAEIRRQNIVARIKLRLLDNEEHLFDAGLYLGFVGTIISLILVSLGVIKPSLMAAYSSTSFGIIFVSIFKIFHLRPEKRRLVLETEASADALTARPRHAIPEEGRAPSTFATTP